MAIALALNIVIGVEWQRLRSIAPYCNCQSIRGVGADGGAGALYCRINWVSDLGEGAVQCWRG